MSSESVCQVARSWVDVGSFHMRLVVRFMIFTAKVRNILDRHMYNWYRASLRGIKQPRREANHQPPSSKGKRKVSP
jgi:hypothetical protein